MNIKRQLILIGGGEHARVLIDAAHSRPDLWSVIGFVDPLTAEETKTRFNLPRFSDDEDAFSRVSECWFVLAFGGMESASLRRSLVERYEMKGARWATIIHASAVVSSSARIEQGAVVFAGAVVNTGASVGRHVIVNTGTIVEHDVRVGDFSILAPGTVIGGGAEIGADAFLGLGCTIRDHVRIGRGSTVAMGAAVVRSVPDCTLVVGIPAREA